MEELKKIEIVYVNKMKYEYHNMFIKLVRFFVIPIINLIPAKMLQKSMHVTSRDASAVARQGGSAHALEVMYGRHGRKLFSRGIKEGIFDIFWHHIISQPAALRNRLKIVKERLLGFIQLTASKKKEISILSVGSGSARAVLSVINSVKEKNKDVVFDINLFDKSGKALQLSKEIAKEYGLVSFCQWKQGAVSNIDEFFQPESFDIIEIVGLLDYFDNEKAAQILNKLYNLLRPGGFLIAANVMPNKEMPFVKNAGWPDMHYREKESLFEIIRNAGFDKEIKLIVEPLYVHIIATAKK